MTNTPAFPLNTPKWHESVSDAGFQDIDFTMGMTLRDYFAAKALPICYQYWMGDYYHPECPDAEERNSEGRDDFDEGNKTLIAEDAYKIADAMMKAREA
jgi:hypothetical protein